MTPPDKCPKCEAGQAESDWTAAYQCGTLLGSTGTFHHTQGCRAFAELRKPLDAERDQLVTEVDTLRTANAALVDRVKRLEEALSSIRDYWNKDNNERAMYDACWHAVNTASEALEAKP